MGGNVKGGSKVTVGYRYYMSIHMGLCRGPIDELVQINVGDVRAWPVPDGDSETESGLALIAQGPGGTGVKLFENGTSESTSAANINTAAGPTNSTIAIKAGTIFGGDKKEGGISGNLTLMFGQATQVVSSWIKGLLGGRVPDFRGVFTVFFDGLICSLNPYPKPWQFRVRRTTNGWDGDVWQPGLATIWLANGTIKAMNASHMIYECLTNRDWGRGWPRTVIDDAAFTAVAQKLYDENFGLCMRWNRQDELGDFIQEIIDHIGGSLYLDRTTGLIRLSLLRDDYDPDELLVFTYDTGLLAIEDDETASRDDLVNETIINWYDPIKNEDRQSRLHNIASMQSLGAIKSTTTPYDGIPTGDLALRVGQRDLKANTTSLKRYKVYLDRRAWRMVPGDVFKISAPNENINSVILRAGKISDGTMTNGKITVEAVLDVFGLAASSFISDQQPEWEPPDRSAVAANQRYFREATYADLVRVLSTADLATVDVTSGTVATIVGKPTPSSQGYGIATKVGAEEYERRNADSFSPVALASSAIGIYDTVISFNSGIDMGLVEVGTPVQIGDEICRLDDIDSEDGLTGTITLARGCIDTLPQAHLSATKIFFSGYDNVGTDGREYAQGEIVSVKILTTTSTQELSIAAAPSNTITINARQGRPWPPGNLKLNGTPFGSVANVTGDAILTWAHRDRLLTQDQLVEHQGGSIGPEAGTTYTVRIYDDLSDTVPVRSESGIDDTTWTYTEVMQSSDGITDTIVFELESVRGGIKSEFRYRFAVGVV